MSDAIPIQNFYYLFCYAWRHYREGALIDVGRVANPTLPNLFATVLIEGVQRLLKRGLDREYVHCHNDLQCLRGKVNVSDTVKRSLLLNRKVACDFDELSVDIAANQILKSTMRKLARTQGIDAELKDRLSRLTREFAPVSDQRIDRALFRRVRIHRNNRPYDFLMRVCEFVLEALLPDPDGRRSRFPDIVRDEQKMARVFEDFVRNFFRSEQKQFQVARDRFSWDAQATSEEAASHLPSMETDISLRSGDRTIVIDTKYYRQALQENFGRSIVRSDNLYQLYAYLKNLEPKGGPDANAEGILLYPSVGGGFDFMYQMPNHFVRVTTVDLTQHWADIRTQLLSLIIPLDHV